MVLWRLADKQQPRLCDQNHSGDDSGERDAVHNGEHIPEEDPWHDGDVNDVRGEKRHGVRGIDQLHRHRKDHDAQAARRPKGHEHFRHIASEEGEPIVLGDGERDQEHGREDDEGDVEAVEEARPLRQDVRGGVHERGEQRQRQPIPGVSVWLWQRWVIAI